MVEFCLFVLQVIGVADSSISPYNTRQLCFYLL
jgi:hypothetical protein